jgi:hypothetical protein
VDARLLADRLRAAALLAVRPPDVVAQPWEAPPSAQRSVEEQPLVEAP